MAIEISSSKCVIFCEKWVESEIGIQENKHVSGEFLPDFELTAFVASVQPLSSIPLSFHPQTEQLLLLFTPASLPFPPKRVTQHHELILSPTISCYLL
jgi:hypothetical protein